MERDVSIVAIAWRNENFALRFAAALAATQRSDGGEPLELIVVVNGPEGRHAAQLVEENLTGTGIRPVLVELEENTGFSGGANAGVSRASGDVVAVVNLDTAFDYRFLTVLRRETRCAQWDLLAPAVREGVADQSAGVARRSALQRLAWVRDVPDEPGRVTGGNGCCLILRRATLARRSQAIGALFDPEYHSFNEDIDLFWWAERQHQLVRYVPDLLLWHSLAGSFDGRYRFVERPPEVQRKVMANYRVTVWKNAESVGEWLGWSLGELAYLGQSTVGGGIAGVRRYAASWPESLGVASDIRKRRGRLRPIITRS